MASNPSTVKVVVVQDPEIRLKSLINFAIICAIYDDGTRNKDL